MKRVYHLLVFPLIVSGCASYHSHYAMFPAENSAGESRHIRLSWQTADYPDWWFVSDQATPILVETQCSERSWKLRDGTDPKAGACGEGIRACGESGRDIHAPSGMPVSGDVRCMAVNPSANRAARIADVGSKLELVVSCRPASREEGQGDEKRNLDYIRASSVPYVVYARKAPRGSLRAQEPKFDDSVCDAD